MGRYPKVQQEKKKGAWSKEEDLKLTKFMNNHGLDQGLNWETISQRAGLNRCGKSSRLRWKNYLSPQIKRGNFSQEEEVAILRLQSLHGNKWSQIAAQLPGRTDNDIKNLWNSKLRKKLQPKATTQYSSLTTDPNNLLANYLIKIFNRILLGYLNMPQPDDMAQNMLRQELTMPAPSQNYPFLPENNGIAPFDSYTSLASDALSEKSIFDLDVADFYSIYDLTEYDMVPAQVSATDDVTLMPMTDEFCVDPNLQVSLDCEFVANEMNYMPPDLGISPAFEVYDGADSLFDHVQETM